MNGDREDVGGTGTYFNESARLFGRAFFAVLWWDRTKASKGGAFAACWDWMAGRCWAFVAYGYLVAGSC